MIYNNLDYNSLHTYMAPKMAAVWLMLAMFVSTVHVTSAQFQQSCNAQRYAAAFNGGFLPKCNPNGMYEPVQCYKTDCWCVKDTGEEIANTRVKAPSVPNCDYPALGATEVDVMKAVIKYKGDDVVFTPYSFGNKSSYDFQSSSSVYAFARDYLPPSLWPDFSILATIRPMSLEGGFLFAITDSLEAVIQLGLSISRSDNEYTQHIDLWYSEDPLEQGTTKIARFTVPTMVGRWSRFAIGVNGTSINLHVYCQQNYAITEYKRTHTQLKFMDSSFLLVGHGGEIFAEQFTGDIQELTLTNDPADAASQCEKKKEENQQQLGPMTRESGSGAEDGFSYPNNGVIDTDDEPEAISPDSGSGFWDDADNAGFDPDHFDASSSKEEAVTDGTDNVLFEPVVAVDGHLSTDSLGNNGFDPDAPDSVPPVSNTPAPAVIKEDRVPAPTMYEEIDTLPDVIGMPGEKGVQGEKGERGDIGPAGIGTKGDKGEPGLQGLPGAHGINGIPGVEGAIGSSGLRGAKGDKGDAGVGERGIPGVPGTSVKGEQGVAGAKGDKGAAGDSLIGPKGEAGVPGTSFFVELEQLMEIEGSGENIEDLFVGIPALELLRGAKGEKGNCTVMDGLPGKDGTRGRDGQPGMPGSPGVRGVLGEKGQHGAAGPKGESGIDGEVGSVGPKGEKGSHGERGQQGLQGPPGPPAVIDMDGHLEAERGEPGTPGLDGEAGEPGEKGDSGEKGSKGDRGGRGMDGEQGSIGPAGVDGQDGAPGAPGLQGADGLNGTKGDKGNPGVGLPGAAGPPGPPGPVSGKPFFGGDLKAEDLPSGLKGDKGETGLPGTVDLDELSNLIPLFQEKGDKGDQGIQGNDGGCKMCVGFKGSRGRRGQRGTKGHAGSTGPKGSIGAPGFPGRDGIPGAPGTPGEAIRGEKGDVGSCDCQQEGVKGEKGEPGLVSNKDGSEYRIIEGPSGPPGPPGETVVGPQGPRGLPGRAASGSIASNLGNVVMYPNQEALTGSSLAMPSGTLGFVMDQQRLYIRVNMGWQALTVGPVIPIDDGEFANSLPSYSRDSSPLFGDAAAASGTSQISGMLRMFALNEPVIAGRLRGISGADFMCYNQAKQAKVQGTFRAVLASRQQSVNSLVFYRDQDLAIVNSKGERVLESWSGVTQGKGHWADGVAIYTFDGTNIHSDNRWSSKYFWHGAQSTGEANTGSYCQAWTSDSRSQLGAGSSYTSGSMLDSSLHTCDKALAVLCIETTLASIYRQR